jgi:ADP-ribose pyrophosphatase
MDIEKDPDANAEISFDTNALIREGFLKIRQLVFRHTRFDGSTSETLIREVMDRGNAAAVLPYDPVRDEVLLIRQVLAGNIVANVPNRPLQVVAGMVEWNESDQDVVIREAYEEAGLQLKHEDLRWAQAFMPSPGGCSERVVTFVARADLSNAGGIHGLAEEHEDIRVEVVSADEAINLLDTGQIESGPAVVALSWFARHRAQLRAEWTQED